MTRDFEDKTRKVKSYTNFTFRDSIMMAECKSFLIYTLRQEAGGYGSPTFSLVFVTQVARYLLMLELGIYSYIAGAMFGLR